MKTILFAGLLSLILLTSLSNKPTDRTYRITMFAHTAAGQDVGGGEMYGFVVVKEKEIDMVIQSGASCTVYQVKAVEPRQQHYDSLGNYLGHSYHGYDLNNVYVEVTVSTSDGGGLLIIQNWQTSDIFMYYIED